MSWKSIAARSPRPSKARAEYFLSQGWFQLAAWEFATIGAAKAADAALAELERSFASPVKIIEFAGDLRGVKAKWIVHFEDGGKGLFKPGAQFGAPYRKYPEKELAVYLLDVLLGIGMTPYTQIREFELPNGVGIQRGSLVYWISRTTTPLDLGLDASARPDLLRLFDALIGNDDRNEGDWLIRVDGMVVAVDHDSTFRHNRLARGTRQSVWESEIAAIAHPESLSPILARLRELPEESYSRIRDLVSDEEYSRFVDVWRAIVDREWGRQ